MSTRRAAEADLDAMVALAAAKRTEYAGYQPRFHKVAPDADAKQRLFLKDQLSRPDTLLLIHEDRGTIDGWIYGRLVNAPPVYEPGGRILFVDDFAVASPALWPTAGKALLVDAKAWGKAQGAVLANVVCGPKDEPKRGLLESLGLGVASEWRVGEL
jgi:hypothetical protein